MLARLLIFLPSFVLIVAAVFLPTTGRSNLGQMNWHELALLLAFYWAIFATFFRIVQWIVGMVRRPDERRGFEITPMGEESRQ